VVSSDQLNDVDRGAAAENPISTPTQTGREWPLPSDPAGAGFGRHSNESSTWDQTADREGLHRFWRRC